MTHLDARVPSLSLFAPSGYLDSVILERARAYFAEQGWNARTGSHVLARDQRFAGTDAMRLADLHDAACAPGLDAALSVRGGYGLTRLLDQIDYERIAGIGRPLVGYSDFTAFNLALLTRADGCSFQGPGASDFWRPNDRPDASVENLRAARLNQEGFITALRSETVEISFPVLGYGAPVRSLQVEGRLWGGNLAMICSLLGTAYFPEVNDGILFVEDVNEPAYRIERMLMQLYHAGVLDRQRALVLGDFSSIPALSNDAGYGFESALAAVRERCRVPLIGGLPFGHAQRRVTLAVGAEATLTCGGDDADAGQFACLTYRGHPRLQTRDGAS